MYFAPRVILEVCETKKTVVEDLFVLRLLRSLTPFVLLLAATVAFAQNVTIVSPSATTVSSPVHVVANFSPSAPIESISVLVDNVEVNQQPDAVTPLDLYVSMPSGNHLLTVNAVQADGLQLTASRSVDVSAPVMAMSTATTSSASSSGPSDETAAIQTSTSGGTSLISHIEEKSGWYMYPDQGNPNCSSKPYLMSSPSLDGTSGRFYLDPTGQFNNCLWPIKLGKSTATHFKLETYFQLSKPLVSQGVEFSSNKHMGTKWYKFSVQCSYYKGVFSVWDTAGSKWVKTSIPCRRPASNTWEHVIVQTEITNGKAVFQSLTHNGVTYTINKSFYPKKGVSSYSFGVHFQMNGNRSGDSYYTWLDNLKYTYW
ncbi:MAG: hypothetical protein DMG97_08350 [Acidobacteria bacterium]|nr:MAG: hypothetical protein DMG97_08350 [Acidobacteriota bacterium]